MRKDWIVETSSPDGVVFAVTQRRHAPLKIIALFALACLGCYVLGKMLTSGDDASVMPVLLLGLVGIILVLGGLAFTLIALPMWILGKSRSSFAIEPGGLRLLRKLKRSYPDRIATQDVSHCYARGPGFMGNDSSVSSGSSDPRHTTVILGGGVYGHTHNATLAAGRGAEGLGKAIGKTGGHFMKLLNRERFCVAMNVRGSEVVIADLLTAEEAEFLQHRVVSMLKG